MKKTLYLKFILAYFIFGVFSFIIVTTFVPSMTRDHLIREKAEDLYLEATRISDTYAAGLYASETDLETVKDQLDSWPSTWTPPSASSIPLAAWCWILE